MSAPAGTAAAEWARYRSPAQVVHVSRRSVWAVWLLAAPAFVAIWSGWVQLGTLTGFGMVQPLPGLWDGLWLDSRITLPVGMEAYAALALRSWLDHRVPAAARRFARFSVFAALGLGAAGQVAYHLMAAAGVTRAPWPVTAVVACLPVAVLGMGAALAHLLHAEPRTPTERHDRRPSARQVKQGLVDRQTEPPHAPQPSRRGHPDPAPARRAARGSDQGSGLGEQVRGLVAQHPDWTQAQVAQRAGCSVRTVRRHLVQQNASQRAAIPQREPTAPADTDTESEGAAA